MLLVLQLVQLNGVEESGRICMQMEVMGNAAVLVQLHDLLWHLKGQATHNSQRKMSFMQRPGVRAAIHLMASSMQ